MHSTISASILLMMEVAPSSIASLPATWNSASGPKHCAHQAKPPHHCQPLELFSSITLCGQQMLSMQNATSLALQEIRSQCNW